MTVPGRDNERSPLRPGVRLGPYEVLAPLGSGGMGEVYRARDERLAREVAVKVLPPDYSADADRLRRFDQEAKAAGALSHPNLLTVHDTGQHEGLPYIVFELLEGATLRQRLGPGALSVAKALDYVIQIAQGLAAAHERGIVHRDLKPENLFLTKDGRVKILDFGLAKLHPALDPEGLNADTATASEITAAGTAMGTAGYMSPEQVQGRRADHRSDIFSLGAVLYEMLSGRRAFQRDSAVETMAAILKEEPPELATIQPDIPPSLDRVVRRCLEKRAEDRFQSARDVAFALVAVHDAGFDEREAAALRRRWRRGRMAMAAGGLQSGLAAIAGLLAALLLASWLLRATPMPQIVGSAQLTFTGLPVSPDPSSDCFAAIVTDGARIFYSDDVISKPGLALAYVSVAGGEVTAIPTPWPNSRLLGISPNGDRLLVMELILPQTEGPLWIVPTSGGAPQRLGDVTARDAAWSPDGKALAYARGEELYVAGGDGTQSRKLAATPGRAHWIRWSPDGRRLRFTLTDTKSHRLSLWEVSAEGADLHALPFRWDERPQECCGEWSRDGRYFVFTAEHDEGADLWMVEEGGSFLRTRSWRPTRLTSSSWNSVAAVPSADGRRLYAVASRFSPQMVTYDPRSRQSVAFPIPRAFHLDYSRDGRWLLYVELRGKKQALKRSRLDGSQALQLTNPPMEIWTPRWSPDGKQIAFTGKLPGKPYKAYVVSREGGAPQQVLEGEGSEIDLDWSPDGGSLMFGRPPDYLVEPGATKAIHIVDLKTKQISTLAGSEGLFGSRWSPDGRHVVAMPLDQHKLTFFDFRTVQWRDLAGPGIGAGLAAACRPLCDNPRWSLDGRYVYVGSGQDVLRVALADRRVERVTGFADLGPTALGAGFDGLTPDGSVLLASLSGGSSIHALDWRVP